MRRVRVRWARLLALALAVACAALAHRVAVLQRAVRDLTAREATAHAAALDAERDMCRAREALAEDRLLCLCRREEATRYVGMGSAQARRVWLLEEFLRPFLELDPPWRVVDYELTSSGSGGHVWLRIERAPR
ncbi:MAG: hypothetical protein M9894_33965 [Planctomycetes bacterium]|nr:hypothetical protein [Planctomycetota bacterium]